MGNIQKLGKQYVMNFHIRLFYCAVFVVVASLLNIEVYAQDTQTPAPQRSNAQIQGPQIQGAPRSQIQGPVDNTQVYSGVVYGPIDQNDTLWRIASRYKQDSRFTVYQTMLAIYELNQQAFENGNFNTMVDGATLQLPSDRYIARIDPQRARAKADMDERALGRGPLTTSEPSLNSTAGGEISAPVPVANLKPEIPLVNQEDLSKTSSQLQSQLNDLRSQQQQQFQQLKNQVAASINSVEVLLDENKKLNEQLLKIDENYRKVTQEVETELQTQIDQQVEQLSQLIALVKDAEQRRIDKESESIFTLLASPIVLVIMMSVVTLLIILVLVIYLLRRPTPANVASSIPVSKDIVDDELVIGEVRDELDQDSEDLMAALSNDDTVEEDDILSDALEDDDAINALSDAYMEDDLDGLDDMLVPDSPTAVSDIDVSSDAKRAELYDEDDAFALQDGESISLEDDDLSLDDDFSSLDLSEPDELTNDNDIGPETKNDGISSITSSALDEVQDKPDGTPAGIDLDKNGEIDENTMEQIGNQIRSNDETITRMADEILEELDKVPSDSSDINELTQDNNVTDTFDTDDLSNELLLDLEEDEQDTSQKLDTALDAIGDNVDLGSASADKGLAVESQELPDKSLGLSTDNDGNALDEGLENEQVSELTDELFKELADDESEDFGGLLDDLKDIESVADNNQQSDTVVSEMLDQSPVTPKEITNVSLDADDLLDDIPSFTSDMSVNDDEVDDSAQDKVAAKAESAKEVEDLIEESLSAEAEQVKQAEKRKALVNVMPDEVDMADTPQNNSESSVKNNTKLDSEDALDFVDESDEDVLAGLKDLDNWLDEDEQFEAPKKAQNDELDLSALALDDQFNSLEDDGGFLDDGLIQDLDNANFDDMLNDLTINDDEKNDATTSKQSVDDPLGSAGLDLDALMSEQSGTSAFDNEQEDFQIKNASAQLNDTSEDFVDVDDLLAESDAMAQMNDSDKELDLNSSLDKFLSKEPSEVEAYAADVESDQASNLDLAQVYIDMEDFEAAKELLDEVVRLGNQDQQQEANGLILNIKPQ
jgi:pilus assembly protein FimV